MKRWLIVLLIVFVVMIACIYMLIPRSLIILTGSDINCAKNAATRVLLDERKWPKWWPGSVTNKDQRNQFATTRFHFNGYTYQIRGLYTDRIDLTATKDLDTIHTLISILPQGKSSVRLHWSCNMIAGNNPLERIRGYQKAKSFRQDMNAILGRLQAFVENTVNVYGFPIRQIISTDSTLIAARRVKTTFPNSGEVYRLIDSMKIYIAQQGAIATNSPMLRVSRLNDSMFNMMVAIPTNRKLEGNGNFFFQRFVPYKTLTCTVKGGLQTIEQGFRQMEDYVEDYQRTSMAVPFQSLVTDRRAVADTLQWITVICQPVS